MLPLFAFALVAQAPIEQPPRLRTLLPNGSTILVERVPASRTLVVDLFVSSRGTEETPATHGRRHLLEHLVALGADEQLDRRLESAGGFLRARTLRECMAFEQTLPPDGLNTGLAALKEIAADRSFTSAQIAREANLIEQEGALRDASARTSEAAWTAAFGDRGLDPLGNFDTIRATKPADLAKLRTEMFSAKNLTVVISGNVDLDVATRAARDWLTLLPTSKATPAKPEAEVQTGVVQAEVEGTARAVRVKGFRAPSTAATLAAAFAMASEIGDGDVIYTPAAHSGLVILRAPLTKLETRLAELRAEDLFDVGRLLATRWVRSRLAEPASAASFRGMLLCQERDLKPEVMLENLSTLNFNDFRDAVDAFRKSATRAEGR